MNEPLAAGFAPVTDDEWREKVVGDRPRPLTTRVDGTLDVAWLYGPEDALAGDPGGAPGAAPFVRGASVGTPWDIRQERGEPARAAANAAILDDLVGGGTAIGLRLDGAARAGHAPGSEAFAAGRGDRGVAVSTLDDLDAVLDGVYLDLAPVALDAGPQTLPAAALLLALWERRGHDLATIAGALRADPLGTWAAEGMLPAPPEEALAAAGALAAEVAALAPNVRALAVDTGAYVEAGATAATELAIAMATGTAYLRAAEAAGLAPDTAATQLEFTLAVGPDQFLEIAKLRAVRRLWARILEASGVPAAGRRSATYARTTARMLSAVDPWVNLLRGTTAAFSAAVGGADGIAVTPFDEVVEPAGVAGPLGRRMARNTQLVLQEESALARVADPAGGSWYVESLTDALARTAWAELQELERAGGIVAALADGTLAQRLGEASATRADELSRRRRTLTGVNAFPLLGDDGLEPLDRSASGDLAALDVARFAERGPAPDVAPLATAPPGARLRAAADLAAAGARIDELAAVLGPLWTGTPVARVRDAEAFERLRTHAAAQLPPPRVYLACLGPLSAHVNVATWAKSFFEVGGIATTPSGAHASIEELAAAFAADGAPLAVVCAGRKTPPEDVAAAVAALRAAGAREVLLAAAPPEAAGAAGADAAVADGVDMLSVLAGVLERLAADQETRP